MAGMGTGAGLGRSDNCCSPLRSWEILGGM